MSKKSTTKARTTRKADPHLYSVTFRENYGRSLTREEIRLIQSYRGIRADRAEVLLQIASTYVQLGLEEGADARAKRRTR